MSVTLRRLSPPKYAAVLQERNQKVFLEERLAHFVDWLRDKGVHLSDGDGYIADGEDTQALIDRYMNE